MKFKILFIFLFFPLPYIFPLQQEDTPQTLATVGNHNISLTEFTDRYSNYLISTGVKDNIVVRNSILNNMINEILLTYYDSNEIVNNNTEYLKELEESRVGTILAYLKDQEIYAKISVTEEEVREAFAGANEKIAARHLYAPTEEEANKLYELLKIGVSFESLASQVFTDSVLKNSGGFIGYFSWGDMDPAFEEAAYSLKVGEISAPVKTAQGYSIIRLEDRNRNPLITENEFQNKKSHMENVLKIRKKIPYESKYISEIFDRSKLSFNNESLENILANLYAKDQNEPADKTKECVSYKEEKYNQAEIEQKISDLPYHHRERIISVEALKAAIEGMLIKDILYNIAVNKGYDNAEPVLNMIEGYKKKIFLKYKIDDITKNSSLPDSVIFNYYKNNLYKFSSERELNLQEIILSDKEIADSLLFRINNEDFGTLAKEFSIRKWSADNDGIMGFAPISKFGSYGEFFWESEIGKIIGPLKVENFYGIFRILGKADSKPIEYEKVKNEANEQVQFEKQTEIVQNYLNLLRDKINVTIDNELLRSHNISDLVFKN